MSRTPEQTHAVFPCISCGEEQVAEASALGRSARCRYCGASFRIGPPLPVKLVRVARRPDRRRNGERFAVSDARCHVPPAMGLPDDQLAVRDLSLGGVLGQVPVEVDEKLGRRLVRLQRGEVPLRLAIDVPAYDEPLHLAARLRRAEVLPRSGRLRLAFAFRRPKVEVLTRIVKLRRSPALRGLRRPSKVA